MPAGPAPDTDAPASLEDLAPRLRTVVMHLSRRMRAQGPHLDGVTPSQLSALNAVERLGTVALGELASAERVQPPTMTRIVASLEGAGLVAREASETDRRVVRVKLTAAGRKLLERRRAGKDQFLVARLASLRPSDQAALERAIPILENLAGGGYPGS